VTRRRLGSRAALVYVRQSNGRRRFVGVQRMEPPAFGKRQMLWTVLTLLPVAWSALYVYEAVYQQWALPIDWANVFWHAHSPLIFVTLAAMAMLWVMIFAVGIGVVRIVRERCSLPMRQTAWFLVVLASLASFYPSDRAYAAAAVALFGPGKNVNRLLQDAARWDSTLIIDALRLRGEKIDAKYLAFAANSGAGNFVKKLLSIGAPVNERFYTRLETPLALAVQRGRHAVAEILVEGGARSDIADARGLTALDHARRLGDARMVSILEKR
jgi:hypothetical protein